MFFDMTFYLQDNAAVELYPEYICKHCDKSSWDEPSSVCLCWHKINKIKLL